MGVFARVRSTLGAHPFWALDHPLGKVPGHCGKACGGTTGRSSLGGHSAKKLRNRLWFVACGGHNYWLYN
jgi:hypothetical protein